MRPGENLRIAGDRIRNWTRQGLLSISGEKNPGTGRARLYKREALLEAVLLQILADNVGITIGNLGSVMHSAKRFANALKSHGVGQGDFLVVSRTLGDEWRVHLESLEDVDRMSKYLGGLSEDTHTLINMKRVFERAFSER
jgi:hypothetical protein